MIAGVILRLGRHYILDALDNAFVGPGSFSAKYAHTQYFDCGRNSDRQAGLGFGLVVPDRSGDMSTVAKWSLL